MIRLLKQTARVILFKSLVLIKVCAVLIMQGLISNLVTYSSSINKYKKYIAGVVIALVILLYQWPSWLSFSYKKVHSGLDGCITSKLISLQSQYDRDDVLIKHVPLEDDERNYVVHVGNGYVGTALGEKETLHVFHSRTLSLGVPYYPNVVVNIAGFAAAEAYATNVRRGVVTKVQCFAIGKYTITVETQTYAHRKWPSLLIQEFSLHNPSDTPVTLDVQRAGAAEEWTNKQVKDKRMKDPQGTVVEYSLLSGKHPVEHVANEELAIAIASVTLPDSITIQPSELKKFQILTAVQYKNHTIPAPEGATESMQTAAEQQLLQALKVSSKTLHDQHSTLWETLWHSGFTISDSKAPGAINGHQVNMTMYYVLSHSRTVLNSDSISDAERHRLEELLYFPHRCFEGHSTLQMTKLWTLPEDLNTMLEHVRVWKITLEKQGCSKLLEAGAVGVMQAMILSLGPLQFKNDHLEYRTDPRDLHRDFFFRRVSYGNNTHLNISVVLNKDNKARLYVALDRNDRPYYACDAGCIDDHVKLGAQQVEFPVKLTEPLTAILYVTADELHMTELKHAIHVKEIAEAPAHENHIIAIHRHGHHLGGLPLLFWGSITFLIILFHAFLFKLIYNEYFNSQDSLPRYRRGQYQV